MYIYNVIFFDRIFITSADFNARAYAATMLITLTHCGLVVQYSEINLGRHGLSNGLLPDGTKSLPEPMLTYYQMCSVTVSQELPILISTQT